jgi:outer membrane receptor protein involved in Fe transport
MGVVLLVPSSAFAQAGRAEINGTIYDQDKAVMPGVNITVIEESTGLQRTTVTGDQGRFVVPTLTPGVYRIEAELQGFQTATQTGLRLSVGQELSVNLTLQLAGIAENLTVSAQAPIVEVTTNRIGTNITNAEIDSLPSAGRNQLSLMQMVPGLIPSLAPGSFEGGQFSSGGQGTSNNVFLVDGAYNNDDRRGGSQGTQAAIALDAMAEYQVLTHQYAAEYGGGTGVVVNSVTKSGSNRLAGRAFGYFKDDKWDANEYFAIQEGLDKPDYGTKNFGGNLGGPFVRNRAFWFFNVEKLLRKDGVTIVVPDDAPAIIAKSYADTQDFTVLNTFVRSDVQVNNNNNLSFRWSRGHELTEKDSFQGSEQQPSNWRHENDAGDQVASLAFTSVLGNHATNELKFGHVREELLQAPSDIFDDDWNFIGLAGRSQFDRQAQNTHPDFTAGLATTMGKDPLRAYALDDAFTYLRQGWGGDHTFKVGGGWSRNGTSSEGQTIGGNSNGTYGFSTNAAFDPLNFRTYPQTFTIRVLGQLKYVQQDWRVNFYAQDKWQASRKLTLNLGVRYDRQDIVPQTKNAFAPRIGMAYDPTGSGNTVIRAGFGKFYQLASVSIIATLQTNAVVTPINQFTTGAANNATDPAQTGVPRAHASGCLSPVMNEPGLAAISPACRAFLENTANQVAAGTFINTEPTVEGDRVMPYTWGFSAGVKRQLMSDLAVSVDYVGNLGRDQTTLLDINVGPTDPVTGRITRLGVNGFDPDGVIVPFSNAAARATNFVRVMQYKTDERFNTDFKSLEVSLEKRQSNRWSGRVSYTLGYANDVGAITDQLNPRADYGRSSNDNRHALAASANIDVWRGLGAGFVFRAYSGNPVNETTGSDRNGDGNNNERPRAGIDDQPTAANPQGLPILSPLDANGIAIRNGIEGNNSILLDGRFQYIWNIQRYQAGLFLEIYNMLDKENFSTPTGSRTSSNFRNRISTNVGAPRQIQLGVRMTF